MKTTAADEVRQKVADADAFATSQGWGRCYSDRLIGNQIIRKYAGPTGAAEGGGTLRINMPASANLSGPEKIQRLS